MRSLWYIFAAIVFTVFQTTLSPMWEIWRITPDFLLITVIIIAVDGTGKEIYYLAPALGYIKDLYSGGPVGDSFLVFFLVVYFIREEKHRLDFNSYLFDLVVLVSTILEGLFVFFLQQLTVPWGINWGMVIMKIFGRGVYNVILAEVMKFVWKNFLARWFMYKPVHKKFRTTI